MAPLLLPANKNNVSVSVGLIQHTRLFVNHTQFGLSIYFKPKPAIVFIPCAFWLIGQKRKYEGETTGAMMSSSCVASCQNKSSRHKTDFLKHTQNTCTQKEQFGTVWTGPKCNNRYKNPLITRPKDLFSFADIK